MRFAAPCVRPAGLSLFACLTHQTAAAGAFVEMPAVDSRPGGYGVDAPGSDVAAAFPDDACRGFGMLAGGPDVGLRDHTVARVGGGRSVSLRLGRDALPTSVLRT